MITIQGVLIDENLGCRLRPSSKDYKEAAPTAIARSKANLTTDIVVAEVVQLQDGLQGVPGPLRRQAVHLSKGSKSKDVVDPIERDHYKNTEYKDLYGRA